MRSLWESPSGQEGPGQKWLLAGYVLPDCWTTGSYRHPDNHRHCCHRSCGPCRASGHHCHCCCPCHQSAWVSACHSLCHGLGHGSHQLLWSLAVHGCHWRTWVANEVELICQCCQGPCFQGGYLQGHSILHVTRQWACGAESGPWRGGRVAHQEEGGPAWPPWALMACGLPAQATRWCWWGAPWYCEWRAPPYGTWGGHKGQPQCGPPSSHSLASLGYPLGGPWAQSHTAGGFPGHWVCWTGSLPAQTSQLHLVAKREEVSPWPAGWALRELQSGLATWASTAPAESKATVESRETVAGTELRPTACQSHRHREAKEPA